MTDPIETAVVVREQPQVPASAALFGTSEPVAVIAKATDVANALRAVIERQGLVSSISGKKYPKCEAWTLLGTMLGVFPVLQWTRPVEGGWEARVEAKTASGQIVGAAEAECLRSEKNWANRDDFALRSMAQTRATAKALRMPLGFVMTLSGFEPTPAEEMTADMHEQPKRLAKPEQKPAPAKKPLADRIAGLQHKLGPIAGHALDYLRCHATDGNENNPALMPNEKLDDLSEAQVDFLAKNWNAFLTWLQAWVDKVDQVPGAEVAPKPAPAKPAITNPHVTGKIEAVSVKEGTNKKGQPWTRVGIKIGEEWFNSFSASIRETAEELKGESVTLEYKETDYGKDALSITDSTGNTVSLED